MAAERFGPIGFVQIPPCFVRRVQQSQLVRQRSTRRHPPSPCSRAAARQNLILRFLNRCLVPAHQHVTHGPRPARPAAPEIPQPDCPPRPSDTSPWSEYRLSGVSPLPQSFVPAAQWTPPGASRSILVPSPPDATAPALRFPLQSVHPQSRRAPFAPMPPCRLSKSLARCAFRPCAYTKYKT